MFTNIYKYLQNKRYLGELTQVERLQPEVDGPGEAGPHRGEEDEVAEEREESLLPVEVNLEEGEDQGDQC